MQNEKCWHPDFAFFILQFSFSIPAFGRGLAAIDLHPALHQTAAALAAERRTSPHELNGRDVREKLHQQHAGPILSN